MLRLTLHLPAPGSLKSKRHLVRSAIDRVKAKFNVSIAEVGENDLWQRSVIGVTAVGNDHGFVNETLDKVSASSPRCTAGRSSSPRATWRSSRMAITSARTERTLAEAEAELDEGFGDGEALDDDENEESTR